MTMDNSDNAGHIFFDRNIDAEQIYIEFFAVAAEDIWNVPVVDGIGEFGIFGVRASNGPVYFDLGCFPKIGFYKSFPQSIDDKIMLSAEIFFSAPVDRRFLGKGYVEIFVCSCGGRRAVELIPEVYVIDPFHTIGKDNVDEMRLQIPRTVINAAGCK